MIGAESCIIDCEGQWPVAQIRAAQASPKMCAMVKIFIKACVSELRARTERVENLCCFLSFLGLLEQLKLHC